MTRKMLMMVLVLVLVGISFVAFADTEVECYAVTAIITHTDMVALGNNSLHSIKYYVSVCDGELAKVIEVTEETYARAQVNSYAVVEITVWETWRGKERTTYTIIGLEEKP